MHAESTVASLEPRRTPAISPVATVDELAAAWLLGHTDSTRRAYARDLRHWLAWLDRHSVGPLNAHRAHVDAYRATLEEHGASPATIARRLSALAGFYGYAHDEGLIVRNPLTRVRRPKVGDDSPTLGLDQQELRALLAAALDSGPRDHALACLLALNGLRISEALAANVEHLSTERGHRTLTVTRKGGRRANVPLAPRTGEAIDAMLAARPQSPTGHSAPLFATRTGRRMDRHAAGKVIARLARAAGIEKRISPHSLRHSFVTLALDAGASLRDVQDAAGHADPRTTRRYDRGRHNLDRHPTYAVTARLG